MLWTCPNENNLITCPNKHKLITFLACYDYVYIEKLISDSAKYLYFYFQAENRMHAQNAVMISLLS